MQCEVERRGRIFFPDFCNLCLRFAPTDRWLLAYLIIVNFFTRAKFLENKIYTEKTPKLRQNTQKLANFFA